MACIHMKIGILEDNSTLTWHYHWKDASNPDQKVPGIVGHARPGSTTNSFEIYSFDAAGQSELQIKRMNCSEFKWSSICRQHNQGSGHSVQWVPYPVAVQQWKCNAFHGGSFRLLPQYDFEQLGGRNNWPVLKLFEVTRRGAGRRAVSNCIASDTPRQEEWHKVNLNGNLFSIAGAANHRQWIC